MQTKDTRSSLPQRVFLTCQVHAKPKLRGRVHHYALFSSLSAGAVLLAATPTTKAKLSVAVFLATVILQFLISSTYHMHTWSPRPSECLELSRDRCQLFC